MDTPPASQKYEDQKAEVKWPVTLLTPQGPIDGITRSISVSHVNVASESPLPSEGEISLLVKTPENRALHMTGEVVSTAADDSDDDGKISSGVEVKLTSVSEPDKVFLCGIVAHSSENKDVQPEEREEAGSDGSKPASTDPDLEPEITDVNLVVSYKKGGKTVTAEVRRLSSKGCICFTKNPHRPGTAFSLKITNPKSNKSVRVDGSVASRNYFTADKHWGMSITFMNVGEKYTEKLRQILADPKQAPKKSVKSKYLNTFKGFVLDNLSKRGRFGR
jgi:hypothetical protein